MFLKIGVEFCSFRVDDLKVSCILGLFMLLDVGSSVNAAGSVLNERTCGERRRGAAAGGRRATGRAAASGRAPLLTPK